MRKTIFLTAVVAAGTIWAEGNDGLVEEKSSNPWHLTIGPVMAPRVRVRVSGPRFATPLMPKIGSQTGSGIGNVPADPSVGYVPRQYVDGYVRPDAGTENPNNPMGYTWDWGADSVSGQYSDGRMEFHSGMSRWEDVVSSSSFYDSGSATENYRDVLLGVDAMGGWTFWENETFDAAVDFGFRFYGTGARTADSRYESSVTTVHNEYRVVDSYEAPVGAFQDGPFVGNPGGPGEMLGATPTRREELFGSSSSTERRYYYGDAKLRYNIWDLRLGPTMGWKATDYLTIRGGVYGLLGLVDAKLSTDANTANGSRGSSKSTCDALFGMAFALSAQLYLSENFFLFGSAEYDWWSDSVRVKNDGASAQLKLSDFTVSAGLGVEF